MKKPTEVLLKSIVAGVFTIAGLGLVANQDWRIALGVFLFVWGNNFMQDNFKVEHESRIKELNESDN